MKSKRKRGLWILLCLAVLLLVVLFLFMRPGRSDSWQPETEPSANFSGVTGTTPDSLPASASSTDGERVQFPYVLADGRIQITSLFRYTGINPDANFEEGENIGALVVTNVSQDYLESLSVTATISDGSMLQFQISDLPAGQTIWAFAKGNGSFDPASMCVRLEGQSSLIPENNQLGASVSTEIQGIEVTLTNHGDSALPAGELRCHMVLNGILFGGTSYSYPVAEIPAGDSITITAADCILADVYPCRLK